MSWPVTTAAEIALPGKGNIVSGPFGSNISSKFFVEEGVPVIRGNNLTNGFEKFNDAGFVFLSEQKASEFSNCEALEGDLIFTAAGTIGQVGIIPKERKYEKYIISNKQLRLRCNKEKIEPLFAFYWFSSPSMVRYIVGRNSGASIPLINLGILRKLPVPLPPLPIQRRIVSTIESYDDLIENNRRRIQLLEESARLLYKEWFVYLRFPGHEHVKVVDGVPEGWEKAAVPDLIEINPSIRVEKGKEIWYVPMSSLSETGMTLNKADFERRTQHTSVKFGNGDVLFPRITPCLENGKTAFVQFLSDNEIACGSTEFIVLRGKRVSGEFTYCLSRTYEFRENAIKSMVGSSGRQRVQTNCFDEFIIGLPPKHLLDQFDEFARHCFHQIKTLEVQNDKLKQARDLLLPRLMNGEIEV